MKKFSSAIILMMVTCLSYGQLRLGMNAPEIGLPNAKDSIIKLSSLHGKYVLIDFWASWCGPCRASIPSLKRTYKKFKDLGFEIFSVSVDDKADDWMRALRQIKTSYTQVVDPGGFYSKTAEQYYIDEIPTSFLLDKEGRIIAINLEGKKLDNRLKELLKSN
jgi:peroxiredoxin